MVRTETSRTSGLFRMMAFCSAIGAGAAIAIAMAVATVGLRPAKASPQFTAQTKLPCTQCHTSAAGGADNLTDLGKKFRDNGNKVPK